MRKIDASYRIIKIFKMLYEKPYSINEIIDEFYRENIIINKETIIKYFKTIRQSGCILRKKQGKFSIESIPFTLNLSETDYENLVLFVNLGVDLYGEGMQQDLKNVMKKFSSLADISAYEKYMLSFSAKKTNVKESNAFKDKISRLLAYGYDNSKIKILYNGEKVSISHISFKYYDNCVYVHAFNEVSKNYELFLLEEIKDIYSTPEIPLQGAFAPYTVFELYGRLAKTYTLYEGERVIKVEDNSIVISNNFEDKKQLYKRLVRYGTLCKIISTKSDIEDFKTMLKEMKNNLMN